MTFTQAPHRPSAVGVHGMVATSSPLAALAGLRALEQGGNACDAALAAAGVLAVVEPNQCGPGGDLFAIVVRDGEEPVGLNASGRSPMRAGRPAARGVRPPQRHRAGVRQRLARAGRAVLPARRRGGACTGDRDGPARVRRAAQGGGTLAGGLGRPRGRRRFHVRATGSLPQPGDGRDARAGRRRELLRGPDRRGDRGRQLAVAGRSRRPPAGVGDAAAVRLPRPHAARAAAQRPGLDRGLGAREPPLARSRPTRSPRSRRPTPAGTPPSATPPTSARPTARAWPCP